MRTHELHIATKHHLLLRIADSARRVATALHRLFMRVLRCAYPRATLLLSYATGHKIGAYARQGWVAPLTANNLGEILSLLQVIMLPKGDLPGVGTPSAIAQPAAHSRAMHLSRPRLHNLGSHA